MDSNSQQAAPDASSPPEPELNDENALETLEPTDPNVVDATSSSPGSATGNTSGGKQKKPKGSGLRKFNLYLILFIFLIVIALLVVAVAYFQSKKASTTSTIKTQTLTQNTLNQVASSDANLGSSQQVLNVVSSAVFAGKVLIRSDLEVAGNLQVGGTTALSELTVSGTAALGQVSISKDLAIGGNTAIQGAATIAKSLQVNGGGTFSGAVSATQVTTSALQLNSDLVLTHHIVAGGATPTRSGGPALGSGGTSSVSGSDTSGSVSINTGNAPAAGCFVTISFSSKYASTPHILLTPVGSAAGGIAYYVQRDSGSFSICDASAPPSGSSFGFDYLVVD